MTSMIESLPGLDWRPLLADDGAALARLERAAGRVPSGADLGAIADLAANSLGAFAGEELAAAGWLVADQTFAHERRVYLHEATHPEHGAAGDALLVWLEGRAGQLLAGAAGVLRIDFADLRPEAIARYERHGFALGVAEDQLRRDLGQPIPAAPIPAGIRFEPWSAENAASWHPVYWAAFSERPGFPGWDRATWEAAFIGYPGFQAGRSLLAVAGDQAAGYAVCAIDSEAPERSGSELWIAQMGVHPEFRQRGLAGALLAAVLLQARADGFAAALLDVNVNNPSARRLYERMGFALAQRFNSYRKPVAGGR